MSFISLVWSFFRSRGVRAVAVFAALGPISGASGAERGPYIPYSGIERGTDGVERIDVVIENDTDAVLVCDVALAHWYSAELGRAVPDGTLAATLWHDPRTGALALLNAGGDRMPVEAAWCGRAGAVHATRARLVLPLAKGPAPGILHRRCRSEADGPVRCIEVEPPHRVTLP